MSASDALVIVRAAMVDAAPVLSIVVAVLVALELVHFAVDMMRGK